jgi:DNA-binding SARP family transcriptional activator
LLGVLDMRSGDRQLPRPPTLKSQSLLAYLAFHRDQSQPRDRLVGLFWGERPERNARRSLSTALWHIRRCLPDESVIKSDVHTVQFDPHADLWLDVEEFEAQASRPDKASLQSALALYRGDFLDGFYDDWVLGERYRLEALFLEALARLMGGHEATGDHQAALATAQRLLGRDPLREDAHRLAMRAYCRLGQRNAALEQYDRCREIVQAELGAEPMGETASLHQAILGGDFQIGPVPETLSVEARPVTRAGRSPLDVITPVRLVGREREMELLEEAWQGVRTGHGEFVLISGEAGVGKTRLVEELAKRLRWEGARVLCGRCYEFERALPFQPLAEALHAALPAVPDDELAAYPVWAVAEAARLVPQLQERPALITVEGAAVSQVQERDTAHSRPASGGPGLDPEQVRLFEGVTHILAALSSRAPLLLVLEDLQWASESTLGLLHHLARHLAECPVLIVGTFRPEATSVEHPLRALRRRLTREGLARPLRLARLSAGAVETMIVEMSGAGEAVVPLAGRLHRETEGNPFFLMEIVKALFETDVVRLEEGAWQGDFAGISTGALPLPTGVSETIQARARRLDKSVQEALSLATVLGREFDFDLLNAAWGRGEEATLEALDALLRHRLIEESVHAGSSDFVFTHHKIQQVVYEGLTRSHRLCWHARVGTTMEILYAAELRARSGELAYHFERARAVDPTLSGKAVHYFKQAGDRARQAYAYQDATDYYRRALALLDELLLHTHRDEGQLEIAARLHEGLGNVFEVTGRHQEARDAYGEAMARVPKQDVIWQSHLYRRIGKCWEIPLCYEEAAQSYHLAESVLGPKAVEPDPRWWQAWIEVRVDTMWLSYWMRRTDRMADLAYEARPAVEEYGTPVERARFFQVLVLMALQRERYRPSEETVANARASLAASQETHDLSIMPMTQFTLGLVCLCRDDLVLAEEALQAARLMAERIGDIAVETRCLTYLTVLHRQLGQVDEVRHYLVQSLEAATTAHIPLYVAAAKANLAWVAWREEDLSEAAANGEAALDLWQQMQPNPFWWLALWPLIGVALAREEVAAAMTYARTLLDPLQQRLPAEMEAALESGVDAWKHDRIDAAKRHLQQAANIAASLGYL